MQEEETAPVPQGAPLPEPGATPGTASGQAIELLRLYCQLQDLPVDAGQLQHRWLDQAAPFELPQFNLALQELGFDAKVVRTGFAGLRQKTQPVVVHLKDGAMAIAGGFTEQGLVLQRQGQTQPQKLARAEFENMWSGQWIEARRRQAGEAGAPDAQEKFGVRWFLQAMQKYRALLVEVLMASLFVQVFALMTPLVFQVVIDKVLTHRSLSTLDVLALALVALAVFEVALSAMRHYLFSHTTSRLDVELGSKLFRHLMRLPMSYFESRRAGDTVARVRELDNARAFLTGQALTSWLDLLFAVVYLAVMFYYSPMLTGIVLAALPVFFAASWIVTPILRKNLEDKFALGAENQAFLVETVTSMETLKGQAVEPQWQRQWERRLGEFVESSFQAGHIGNATNQFIGFASKVLTVLLLWFGARAVIDGDLTVGGLIAFNMLSGRVNAPILKLASLWQEFTQMKVSVKRLGEIMDAPAEPGFQAQRAVPPAVQGAVKFDHVGFRYQPNGREVLSDVSFQVQPGEVIGIVGVSGAGKTTLLRLLQRLYTPQQGRILVDGMDLNLLDASWLRRQMGVVSQDSVLFNRSVRENIALADQHLSMEAIMNAAKLAGAHEFILELPEGYDTLIGERGSRLSGGQRSRLAIARALVTNPRLLLLDEATAALDYESERVIHDNMAEITVGRTVFIVAHRLPTLRMANRILVFEGGRLVESGSHASLMAAKGRYHDLYQAHQILETTLKKAAAEEMARV
ncbi:Type I secretion system ATPase, HlyB [Hydrogenophaga taeniospiralis CCUG 15921]|uniref:Cyclolysin secretion/processing ATP-binding protein CyaB n=1 Tax=Hydrogenophaga taeniospiralis CCUG 15921 TaxID=1281780 RepID=A0A9X4NTP9_9BURK|nr:type I secretion system permease/ATPase [Hydrogenophaga taeniospiralis]MDG5974175.1 Type I secretion system ATPase, HlyB [Hydrogenophaga taeniospiralis CCUG 15921]